MPKSYRIRTTPGTEKTINVQLEQDFEFLEILSLKINQGDIYNRMCSDYGVIIGRVLVNNGYGVPNARVSVFIPIDDVDIDNPIISELYPYRTLSDVSEDGYRYNLLPKEPSYTGHAATGTFPSKEEILIDQSYVEVYDKYYRFSVRTNELFEVLGEGSFSKVYRALFKPTGEIIAVKVSYLLPLIYLNR